MPSPSVFSDTRVLMATRGRVGYLEYYAAEGCWDGIPVVCVADGPSEETLRRLQYLQRRHPEWTLHTYRPARGVGYAKGVAIRQAEARHVVFCDDDDVMTDLPAFVAAGREMLCERETLFVTVPRMYAFGEHLQFRLQYDRWAFAGKTGRELLTHLVCTGEMSALVAGSLFRRDDLVDAVPEPLFEVSEDYVLLARLCARFPERRVAVAQPGRYLRLVHGRSLSARPQYTAEKAAMHLVGMCVGAYYLIEPGWLRRDDFADLLRQRGRVLQRSYGLGEQTAAVLVDLLQGESVSAIDNPEARSTLAWLRRHRRGLPREFQHLLASGQPRLIRG